MNKELIVTMKFKCLGDKELTQEVLEKIILYSIYEKVDVVDGVKLTINKKGG